MMSDFDLTHVEAYLSGKLATGRLAVHPHSSTERVLGAYGVAISCPSGAEEHRQAILPIGGLDWLLMVPITTLFTRVFAGHRVNCESMRQASRNVSLHYGADHTGAMLALPEELVALAQKYENHPRGAARRFYRWLERKA